ncbi:hypothetical protein [Streptomyces sp. Ncost-T10-10d]|uniref:hypothetical protein n=1 Tax=Streptomyces sp. Ncost-T10-10d TaxID=1839774 RepID=UPI00081E20AA|nr:hypothetical protein [Streptomyces sp. Ncost-T10-10d]SCF82194.1 hypothetical protein GA0115254_11814 [Streptomyces sp. Ncost-T10-10d]
MNHLDVVRLLGLDAPVRTEGGGHEHVIPEDCELLLQAVQKGVIAGSVLLGRAALPVRSLEHFTEDAAPRIEDMEASLRTREQELPLPFFPNPGGMVPWGRTARDGVLLWDTTDQNTANWTTVLAERDFQVWLDLPFSASEFITRALLGRPEGVPAFETYEEYESNTFWNVADDMRQTATTLANPHIGAVEEILTVVRSVGIPGVRQYAEELLDRAVNESFDVLPEDYLTVMREFPGGVIAGVRVFPVAGDTAASPVLRWLDEDRLFLQWGEVEGRATGWLTTKGAPQDWRIACIEPNGSALTCLEDQTFATFLRRRLRGNNSLF